jgi:hypothetical protein
LLGRCVALVLVLFCRLLVSFLPLYLIWGMCGWAQTIGSIGEAEGGFLFVCFAIVRGCGRQVAVGGVGDGEMGSIGPATGGLNK